MYTVEGDFLNPFYSVKFRLGLYRFFFIFLLLVAIFIIIILELLRIFVLVPAEPISCFKAQKIGILHQTQELRFFYCNRLKQKFFNFYYTDNASCILRCCVLIYLYCLILL